MSEDHTQGDGGMIRDTWWVILPWALFTVLWVAL